MKQIARVAPAFRGLVAAFCRDELCLPCGGFKKSCRKGKFATVEHRRQPAERGRYPEEIA